MAGYTRQSAAQIISGEVISASPINAEYNQLLAAFNNSTGHKHDGTTAEGPPIALIADADQRNKVLIDTNNDELEFYIEQGGVAEQQLSIKHQIIEPTADNDVDLGSSSKAFKDIHAKGTTNLVGLTVTGNLNLNNITSSSGTLSLGSNVDIDGGNIDGTVIGANSASAITGTVVTATTNFAGNITGNVTGNVTGDVTGNLTGNVTANSGTSTFNDVTVNGTLNMVAGGATIDNVTDPTQAQQAATKNYVDTQVAGVVDSAPAALDTLNELAAALNDDANFSTTVTNSLADKVNKDGSTTMTGALTLSGNPTNANHAANKAYADTKLPLAGGTLTGDLTLSGAPTQNLHAATKQYVDTVAGSNAQAATSAAQAATSANNAATSATNAANSATSAATSATNAANSFDSFDDRYLGAKSSSPATDNDGDALITGALYFDTTAGEMRVYDGNSWAAAGSAVNGTSQRQVYVATANQTTFNITYDVGYVDAYLNGLKLRVGTDFTATSGTNIVLASGANVGDIVDLVAYGAFNVANTYTQAQADARYTRIANNLSELTGSASTARANIGAAPTASPTFTGTITMPTDSLNYAGTAVTASGAELNKLDGATASTAELNKLTGLTASTAELNKLAGATASTAELNYVTGVTSAIQTQLDAKASTGKAIAMAIVFGG